MEQYYDDAYKKDGMIFDYHFSRNDWDTIMKACTLSLTNDLWGKESYKDSIAYVNVFYKDTSIKTITIHCKIKCEFYESRMRISTAEYINMKESEYIDHIDAIIVLGSHVYEASVIVAIDGRYKIVMNRLV